MLVTKCQAHNLRLATGLGSPFWRGRQTRNERGRTAAREQPSPIAYHRSSEDTGVAVQIDIESISAIQMEAIV
jgi:hypothetical protein